jgi:hypothetical protein
MRDEREIRELKEKLDKLTAFITDYANENDYREAKRDVAFAADVSDALAWVLGEIPTKDFESEAYLRLAELQRIVNKIEKRTGKRLQDYE